MAFEGLTEKLQNVFKGLKSRGKLSESDVKEAMREVRMALLEADVNFAVARDFVKKITEKAVGEAVLNSLTPGQQVIKIVNEELVALMGSTHSKLTVSSKPPSVYMLCGLQGAGKTTMCAKLGGYLRKQGKKPLLVACDIYRPAAIDQLKVVGKQLDITVFDRGTQSPVLTAQEAIKYAQSYLYDTVILDTAGRLHIDEALMNELVEIKSQVRPTEILLTVDAMTGQDAVNVAQSFNEKLGIDGVILTKLDGDARGGAAMSVKAVTGKPIKFSGIGEKLNDIEPFHPDRMASRILGMGDVLSLIEKAQENFDEKEGEKLVNRLKQNKFDLQDFLDQFKQMRKMGSMKDILKSLPAIPGMDTQKLSQAEIDEKRIDRIEAIILSMTKKERKNPDLLNASRRKRIAAGSGTSVQEVNQLIRQFEQTKTMMKRFSMFNKKGHGRFPKF
ncbi:MAG: signal recognition particle protein [Clostridiales bacterium]|nr:signal recognition particle protein [Clostridiales bacterium]